MYSKQHYDIPPTTKHLPRSSAETYASTVESFEELCDEPDTYDPDYQVPEYREVADTNLRPSNPSDFAEYFPTTKRLHICHDDTTCDRNMNLRVDAEDRREKGKVQLFHLRMHDIKKRDFSLRRYERSSGREVCKSSRKYQDPAASKRPATLSRSVSSAFASMVKPDFHRTNSGFSTKSSKSNKSRKEIKRQDSGYGSDEEEDTFEEFMSKSKDALKVPTNTTKLEFSNYAQVEVKRRGSKSTKRWEFEYWGSNYVWNRVIKKDGTGKEISFQLCRGDSQPIARIVPDLRDKKQIREEVRNGGWGPPCSMWIHDQSVVEALTDVADVIVATGLIALVDDCIKRRFHTKPKHHQVAVPLTSTTMEFVTPKAMVEHLRFKRRNSSKSERTGEQRSSPLRYVNPVHAH